MTATHSDAPFQRYPGPPLPSDGHIRLVSLQPGTHDSPIVCELVIADLSSVPPYEALSYTWGDPSACQVIYIKCRESERGSDEEEKTREFRATKNCVAALRRLRLEDSPRTLWIDALGIDQSNVPERNHQVSLMSQIYRKSKNVAIYLGEADEHSDLALEAIRDVDDPGAETTALSHARSDRLIQALEAFFRRPWFTRVWVIQEAVLSERGTAYCGAHAVEWSAIRKFDEWNANKRWLSSLPFVVSTSRGRLVKGNDVETAMLKALRKTRHCEATDPRDKVYSLLPLMHSFDKQLSNIAPRYHEPVAKVYADCAAALIERLGYQVLHSVQGSTRIQGLPSWAPDWSAPLSRRIIGARGDAGRDHFWEKHKRVNAPHQPILVMASPPFGEGGSRHSLRVAGYSVGKIQALGSTYLAGKGLLPLEEWEGLIPPDRAMNWLDDKTFYMVIVFDCYAYPPAIQQFLETEREREAAGSEVSWEHKVRQLTAERGGGKAGYVLPYEEIPFHLVRGLPPSYARYVQFVLRNCHSRRFLVTDRGDIGLAPAEARVGDEVVVCVGADAPFVMRECGCEGRRRYSLVGECFMELKVWMDVKGMEAGFEEFEIV